MKIQIGIERPEGCLTCHQELPVEQSANIHAAELAFREYPTLKTCPRCLQGVAGSDVYYTPEYRRRWQKATSKFFRQ